MLRHVHRRRNGYYGRLMGGLILVELGFLQFFHVQIGLEWSNMWPILITIPGLVLVLNGLPEVRVGRQDQQSSGKPESENKGGNDDGDRAVDEKGQ